MRRTPAHAAGTATSCTCGPSVGEATIQFWSGRQTHKSALFSRDLADLPMPKAALVPSHAGLLLDVKGAAAAFCSLPCSAESQLQLCLQWQQHTHIDELCWCPSPIGLYTLQGSAQAAVWALQEEGGPRRRWWRRRQVCVPAIVGTKLQHGTEAALSMCGCLIWCTLHEPTARDQQSCIPSVLYPSPAELASEAPQQPHGKCCQEAVLAGASS